MEGLIQTHLPSSHLTECKKDLLIGMKTGRKSHTVISHSIGFLKASLVMEGACIVHLFV